MKTYKPIWPETTILWGAGATAELGMPATEQQGINIWKLAKNGTSLEERIKSIDLFSRDVQSVYNLLSTLGDKLESDLWEFSEEETNAARDLFPKVDAHEAKRRVIALRQNYDWDALKRIIEICPSVEGKGPFMNDLFNILDMHILSGQGFYTKQTKQAEQASDSDERFFIQNYRLRPARNCLVMLINLQIYCAYHKTIQERPEKFEPYIEFAETLAILMREEGLRFAEKEQSLAERQFYLFSYSVISMNFDPILLWLIFNAHKTENDRPPHIGTPARPMKLFHDMGHFMGVRRVDDKERTPRVWYPFNEAVAQRLNDPEHTCDRISRLGKFYFPHGCCCWRECPNCGKLTVHLGDEWGYRSKSLFPATLIPSLKRSENRSKEEEQADERGIPDGVQCAYCGTITRTQDIPMIMQSSFKGNYPPFLEEIHRDLKVCLENTNHIVLMGYSLPPDDVVWRSILATRKSQGKDVYCSVVVGYQGEKAWLSGEQLEEYVTNHEGKKDAADYGVPTIKAAFDIFEKPFVRAYTGGIPQVWGCGSEVKQRVLDLLYPTTTNIKSFSNEGVTR